MEDNCSTFIVKKHSAKATSDSKYIYACCLNLHSLQNKIEDMETLTAMHRYHVFGIAKSWLDLSNRYFIAECSLSGCAISICERENRIGVVDILCIHNSLHPISVKAETFANVGTFFIEKKRNL